MVGWRAMAADNSRPASSDSRISLITRPKAGLMADSCKPARPRMMGTPAFSKVYSWRLNNCTSIGVTFFSSSLAHQLIWLAPAPVTVCVVTLISTGVIPPAINWSATALLSAPSITPVSNCPLLLRALYAKNATSILGLVADTHGFADRRAAGNHQLHDVAAQGLARHLRRRYLHEVGRIGMVGGVGHGARDFQQFIHARTAPVTHAVAMRTALAVEILVAFDQVAQLHAQPFIFIGGGRIRRAAAFTDHAHQALRQHRLQRTADHVTGHAHVHQAQRRADGVVGMQGRQYQVTRHSRAQTDLRRFLVAHLAQQHDVRILPQG